MIGLFGFIIGALLITYLLTRLLNWIFRKIMNKKSSAILSFLVALILCFLLRSPSLKIEYIYYIYLPGLFIWLILDLKRASKKIQKDEADKSEK